MLAGMSATQYCEMMLYFRVEHEAREERKIRAQESQLQQFFSRKIAQQKRNA